MCPNIDFGNWLHLMVKCPNIDSRMGLSTDGSSVLIFGSSESRSIPMVQCPNIPFRNRLPPDGGLSVLIFIPERATNSDALSVSNIDSGIGSPDGSVS